MAKRNPSGTARPASRKAKSGRIVQRDPPSGRAGTTARGVKSKGQSLPGRDYPSVPATQAKNRFGEILLAVREVGPVYIERHGQAQAVVLGIDAYNKLVANERTSQQRELDYWTREFQALAARMQTSSARQAVDALFSATDDELNRRGT